MRHTAKKEQRAELRQKRERIERSAEVLKNVTSDFNRGRYDYEHELRVYSKSNTY